VTSDAYIREDYCESAHKLLHEQREAYIAQSARSRDGNVAEFARRYAAEQSPCEPASYEARRG
jgi:hypothetical protein